jgi:predicted AlkP superfamily phosphohydrolase/phosphomutase
VNNLRSILIYCVMAALPLPLPAAAQQDGPAERMIILGVDGMDPVMLAQFMRDGDTPNLKKLAEQGGFTPLGTSTPPQSPVAWSNFITGMDPGGHGIFDFVALDRDTMLPYLSSARVEKGDREPLALGRWRIPLSSEQTVLLRDGQAFWEILDAAGIPVTMFRVPVNYPPIQAGARGLSGMGTPDLRGTSGTFTFFTDAPDTEIGSVSGGIIKAANIVDGEFIGAIEGPNNAFLEDTPRSVAEFRVSVDAEHPVALIEFADERALLNVGEWSDWVAINFEMVPGLVEVPGMVRVYLKQIRPHFSLYVSPVNIDPRNPAQPISIPAEYAFELAEASGPFYTQEMPEDTKALSAHVLTPDEFLTQSGLVMGERRRLLRRELQRFRDQGEGSRFLFFYLSSVDQRNHMLARQMDAEHPFHEENTPTNLAEAMRTVYKEVDEMVGWVLEDLDSQTRFVVMSDHGFAPFRRQANLNSWLEQNGYLKLKNPSRRADYEWLLGIDWSQTRAFGIGLNSLYLNVSGREKNGIVAPAEREALAREIAARLETWTDPETGEAVVTQPLVREDVYHGPHVAAAPDIIVGYARGYRASWATSTGKIPATLIEDNDKEWSGDHCMDARAVPGVLLSNRPLKAEDANLRDMPVSILHHFGIKAPPQMGGREVF